MRDLLREAWQNERERALDTKSIRRKIDAGARAASLGEFLDGPEAMLRHRKRLVASTANGTQRRKVS